MTLLTLDEFRTFVATELVDDSLQILLDAAEQAIAARYGPLGADVEEMLDGGFTYLFLRRRASAITSIAETDVDVETTLDELDYRLRADGVSVRRLATGPNIRSYWGGPVTITYTPADDLADRQRVQKELVALELGYTPGVTSERIGDWEETKAGNSAWNAGAERETILASLVSAGQAPGFA